MRDYQENAAHKRETGVQNRAAHRPSDATWKEPECVFLKTHCTVVNAARASKRICRGEFDVFITCQGKKKQNTKTSYFVWQGYLSESSKRKAAVVKGTFWARLMSHLQPDEKADITLHHRSLSSVETLGSGTCLASRSMARRRKAADWCAVKKKRGLIPLKLSWSCHLFHFKMMVWHFGKASHFLAWRCVTSLASKRGRAQIPLPHPTQQELSGASVWFVPSWLL